MPTDDLVSVAGELIVVGVALAGSALGFVVTRVWDRYVGERFASTEKLLERLARGTVRATGRERLRSEANSAMKLWQRHLEPPPVDASLLRVPDDVHILAARPADISPLISLKSHAECGASPVLFLQPKIETFFQSAESAVPDTDNVARTVGQAVADQFADLANLYPHSDALIRTLTYTPADRPVAWIALPKVVIRSVSNIKDTMDAVRLQVSRWIPECNCVVEAYVPDDLLRELQRPSLGFEVVETTQLLVRSLSPSDLSEAIPREYIQERKRAVDRLAGGMILGLPDESHTDRVPAELLVGRLVGEGGSRVRLTDEWTTISISGPPGSGKTQLQRRILLDLCEQDRALVLCFMSARSLEFLGELSVEDDVDVAERIARAFAGENDASTRKTPAAHSAFYDVMIRFLLKEPKRVVIAVDDLDHYDRARASLLTLQRRSGAFGWRYVLASRRKPGAERWEQCIRIPCQLWVRDEACAILKQWLGADGERKAVAALDEGWFAHCGQFSLYLLRLIHAQAQGGVAEPTTLLSDTINRHLELMKKPLAPYLESSVEHPEVVLLRVMAMLETGIAPRNILEFVRKGEERSLLDLVGLLSWHSLYSSGNTGGSKRTGYLSRDKIMEWSKGTLPTEESAKAFIAAGIAADVLRGEAGFAMWHDKLVADGAAALYLGREVGRVPAGTVASMVETLDEVQSIDILTLALDLPILLQVLEALIHAKLESGQVISSLISDQVLSRLKTMPDYIDLFGNQLLGRAIDLANDQLAPLAFSLARLSCTSPNLDRYLRDMAVSGGESSRIGLAVLAAEHLDNSSFFGAVRQLGCDLGLSIEMAAEIWEKDGGRSLACKIALVREGELRARSVKSWSIWCARQAPHTLFDRLHWFWAEDEIQGPDETIAELLDVYLGSAMVETSKPVLLEIRRYVGKVKVLIGVGRHRCAEVLAKWIVYAHDSTLAAMCGRWVVDREGRFATPCEALYAPSLKDAYSRAFSHPARTLASKRELEALRSSHQHETELIRDELPRDYVPDQMRIAGYQRKTWNGREVGIVGVGQEAQPVLWRPRIDLLRALDEVPRS